MSKSSRGLGPSDDQVARILEADVRQFEVVSEQGALLQGDAIDTIAALKNDQATVSFWIMGSQTLIRALMARDLIDEWLLMIHPLVLGKGLRLFDGEASPARLTLADSVITTTGVILATYRTAATR